MEEMVVIKQQIGMASDSPVHSEGLFTDNVKTVFLLTDAEISKLLCFYLQLVLWSCENISWHCQALGTSPPFCSSKSAGVQETYLKGQGYIKRTGDLCCPGVFPVSFLADRLISLMLFVAFLCGFGYIPHF